MTERRGNTFLQSFIHSENLCSASSWDLHRDATRPSTVQEKRPRAHVFNVAYEEWSKLNSPPSI